MDFKMWFLRREYCGFASFKQWEIDELYHFFIKMPKDEKKERWKDGRQEG
jgi:hypothetical protein